MKIVMLKTPLPIRSAKPRTTHAFNSRAKSQQNDRRVECPDFKDCETAPLAVSDGMSAGDKRDEAVFRKHHSHAASNNGPSAAVSPAPDHAEERKKASIDAPPPR